MDVVTLGAALNGSKKYTDQVAQSLMGGVHYRGSVSYYADLPSDPAEGDSYTVKYAGTSGSVEDGTEYTWGYDTDTSSYAWISFSKDAYSKAETDVLLGGKQNTIDANHKLDGGLVSPLTGYTKSQTGGQAVSPSDSLNGALGKIEKRVSDNENNISLKANTTDVNAATANLQSQINQIAQAAGTGTADTEIGQARVGADGTSYQTLKARLDAENTAVNNSITNVSCGNVYQKSLELDKLAIIETANLFNFDSSENESGYIISNGGIVANSSYKTSHIIAVEPSTTYYIGGSYNATYGYKYLRFICEFGADGKTVTGYSTDVVDSITVSNSTHYVRFSYGSATNVKKVYWGTEGWNGSNAPKFEPKIPKQCIKGFEVKNHHVSVSGDMASGGTLDLSTIANSVRKYEVFSFSGDITTFGSIELGVKNSSSKRNRIIIDDTKLKVSDFLGNFTEYTHGLTIKDNIQVLVESTATLSAAITIVSSGERFKQSVSWNRRYVVYPYVESIESVLTSCKFSWTCKDFNKDIWIFGDSYMGYSDRWTYYMHQYGYDENVLLDAFAGENGAGSTMSFTALLSIAKPKMAIYCLGMNDGTDNDSTYSEVWKTSIDRFLYLCKENDIEPILATIPTVPEINHEKKNEWVRNSQYRYIDFAKAVGATSNGEWYDGMLYSDNVHPTDKGAKALFMRAMADAPEIMVSC